MLSANQVECAPKRKWLEMRNIKIIINKPFSVGVTVLQLSKLQMYGFHYFYFWNKYPAAKILFTDSDSLLQRLESARI